jgi:hypothetical protein
MARLLGSLGIAAIVLVTFLITDVLARGGGSRGGGLSSGGHTSVKPYTKRDGTYVQPHHRTAPNSTQRDNFSSRPNVNPYTGHPGTREPQR